MKIKNKPLSLVMLGIFLLLIISATGTVSSMAISNGQANAFAQAAANEIEENGSVDLSPSAAVDSVTGSDEDKAKTAVEQVWAAREGFDKQIDSLIEMLGQDLKSWNAGAYNFAIEVSGILKAAGVSLIIIFFGIGLFRTSYSLAEHKNFGSVAKALLRLGVATAFVMEGPTIALQMFRVGTGFVNGIGTVDHTTNSASRNEVLNAVGEEKITITSHPILKVWMGMTELAVYVAMIMITVFVVMRFFKFLIYIAVSPMPLAALAGDGTEQFAYAYLKALAGVALEALVIVLALKFFQILESNGAIDGLLSKVPFEGGDEPWIVALKKYCVTTLLSCAAAVATVMGADRIVTKAFGT